MKGWRITYYWFSLINSTFLYQLKLANSTQLSCVPACNKSWVWAASTSKCFLGRALLCGSQSQSFFFLFFFLFSNYENVDWQLIMSEIVCTKHKKIHKTGASNVARLTHFYHTQTQTHLTANTWCLLLPQHMLGFLGWLKTCHKPLVSTLSWCWNCCSPGSTCFL